MLQVLTSKLCSECESGTRSRECHDTLEHGIVITFERRKYVCGKDIRYRTDKGAWTHKECPKNMNECERALQKALLAFITAMDTSDEARGKFRRAIENA